jgi:hypothetical protein
MSLSIMCLFATLSMKNIDSTQHNNTLYLVTFMLSVALHFLFFIVILNVVMLNVVAPYPETLRRMPGTTNTLAYNENS